MNNLNNLRSFSVKAQRVITRNYSRSSINAERYTFDEWLDNMKHSDYPSGLINSVKDNIKNISLGSKYINIINEETTLDRNSADNLNKLFDEIKSSEGDIIWDEEGVVVKLVNFIPKKNRIPIIIIYDKSGYSLPELVYSWTLNDELDINID